MATTTSVVIPALNEEHGIAAAIQSVSSSLATTPHRLGDVETIVVDGGSQDRTVKVARGAGAKVIVGERGRAKQLIAGAAAARGDVLVFLHADSRLPAGASRHIADTLSRPGVVAGAFRLKIGNVNRPELPAPPSLRVVAYFANLRSQYFQKPYGDQGLFLYRRHYDSVGGFPNQPFMEDYEMVRRLSRRGRVALVRDPLGYCMTSGRRWEAVGVVPTTMLNWAIVTAYHLGVPPDRLGKIYRGVFNFLRR